MEFSISDVELEVEDRGLTNESTEDIVLLLTFEALETWARDVKEIKRLLWDEKLNDNQGQKFIDKKTETTGDYITAVHLWARGRK